MTKEISLVIPSVPSDINKFLSEIDNFRLRLPISNIYIICNLKDISITKSDSKINLIDEDSLIKYDLIKQLLLKRSSDPKIRKRVGWYLQQFLKMNFARICKDNYYLLWDSDTIPLKYIDLFDSEGKPYLDFKSEYHKPYFDTLYRILPGYQKIFSGSFISEHMLINSKHMRELLDLIEANTSVPGNVFYEKIINAISIKDISDSGFSEFETYGTYVYKNYLNEYHIRQWRSFRFGGLFFSISDINNKILCNWLSSYYDAISFEKGNYISSFGKLLVKNRFIRNYSPVVLDYIAYIIRAKRRIINR